MSHLTPSHAKFLLSEMGFESEAADQAVSELLARCGTEDIPVNNFLFKCCTLLSQQNKELLSRVQSLESMLI